MPIYTYKHPHQEEYKEVVQGMNEPHTFSEEGVEWQRVFLPPNTAASNDADPFCNTSFIEKTANMKGTVGDMMDYSAELSAKRAEKAGGEDPVKRKHFKEYEKLVGKKHVEDRPKSLESQNIKIDFD